MRGERLAGEVVCASCTQQAAGPLSMNLVIPTNKGWFESGTEVVTHSSVLTHDAKHAANKLYTLREEDWQQRLVFCLNGLFF